jgi:hypothetical protein
MVFVCLILTCLKAVFALVFSTQTLADARFMSLLCLMAFAQQRVNTHFFGICGDNHGSN